MEILYFKKSDYLEVKGLYELPNTFGGQYDPARDTLERLSKLSIEKPGSILVARDNDSIVGTVTIFEDGRSCWLYRFAVKEEYEEKVTQLLNSAAEDVCKDWGHEQLLVFAPAGNIKFENRYISSNYNKGGDFTAYWKDLK